jgi:hypothetical protein
LRFEPADEDAEARGSIEVTTERIERREEGVWVVVKSGRDSQSRGETTMCVQVSG